MTSPRSCGLTLRATFVAATLATFSQSVAAQAWLSPPGSFDCVLVYNNEFVTKHYLPDGGEVDVGHTRSYSVSLGLAWALTDRVTVSAGVPWVNSKYAGDRPHPTEIDSGDYHDSVTDYRVTVNYQALDGPVAIAPYVAYSSPATRYETLGHAAGGRGLDETWVGFFAGASLDRWIPRTYVQGRYNYAFVEKVAGVSHDKSTANLEVGWFAMPTVDLRTMVAWQTTHGGIDVPVPTSHPLYEYHDQLGAEGFLNVGVGASWQFSRNTGVFVSWETSVRGENGHKLDHGITIGFSQRFTLASGTSN